MRVMARSRSLVGCWTCRLRRKKCDEGRPICVNCSALEIECFFDDAKPEWMDGGNKQRERAEWLKLEVKRLAPSRRERRFMRGLENLGEERTETAGGEDEVMVDQSGRIPGGPNWVIISMGKISALSSWKKSQMAKGQLSITQLVSRANEIETCLRQNMADFNLFLPTSSTPSSSGQATSPSPGPMTPSTPSTNTSNSTHGIPLPCPTNNPINPNPLALDPLSIYLDPRIQNQQSATLGNMMGLGDLNFYKTHDPTSTGTTYVFAQATLTYLYLVANGYQPLAPEIRGSVALTLSMLKALPTRTCVRTVIWPFTITGCLALEEEQDSFRDFVERMGRVGELGSVKKALGVMRGVWDWRKEQGGMKKKFDLGEMFSGGLGGETATEKGKPVLLV